MPLKPLQIDCSIKGAPTEIQVMPRGRHSTGNGDFTLDGAGARRIIEDFNSRENDMVIDYEHQTLGGGEAPAAGWIKELIDKGNEGIWAMVQWTEKAKEYLKAREYRYLSPVFLKSVSSNEVIRLINVALTNQPAIDGMVPIVSKAQCTRTSQPQAISKNLEGSVTPDLEGSVTPDREGSVTPNKPKKEVFMKELFELLGLSEEGTAEQAAWAIRALKSEVEALKAGPFYPIAGEVLQLLGLSVTATSPEIKGTVAALKQAEVRIAEIPVLEAKVVKLKAALREAGAEDLVEAAMKQGKVTPAQRDWAMQYAGQDPEGFRVFTAKAPMVIPTGEIVAAQATSAGVISSLQSEANRMLGVSDEAFKKHNV